jgi:hypothetical protein
MAQPSLATDRPRSAPRRGGRRTRVTLVRARAVLGASTVAAVTLAATTLAAGATPAGAAGPSTSARPFLARFSTVTVGTSTVPGNGDVNPYGIVVVRRSAGDEEAGATLVSNFNDAANAQGTGTTIVQISATGKRTVFARISSPALPGACPGGIGLTTALTVLPGGWVVVGSLPTVGGKPTTAMAGCLLVLNDHGQVVETWSGAPINGPWDLTAVSSGDRAELFVTNVLNGTVAAAGPHPSRQPGGVVDRGTVVRLDVSLRPGVLPTVTSETVVATGFPERTDPAALVMGPTGVALGRDGTLYVADTVGNRIAAVADAGTRVTPEHHGGRTVSAGGALVGPLGVALAPNGDVLAANGGNGDLVEVTPAGTQVDSVLLDASGTPPGAGALFGLALPEGDHGVLFVDDATNNLELLH